jgi:hypothetical protein
MPVAVTRGISLGALTLVVASCGDSRGPGVAHASSDSVTIAEVGVRVAAACYRSSHSVLLGPPTPSGQQGRGPGWMALEVPEHADSGWAVLVDPGTRRFSTRWRRDATDSIALHAGDDFLQLDMRLAASDSLVHGSASARSDAALERDSSGSLKDLERHWILRAVRAPCDSLPADAGSLPRKS